MVQKGWEPTGRGKPSNGPFVFAPKDFGNLFPTGRNCRFYRIPVYNGITIGIIPKGDTLYLNIPASAESKENTGHSNRQYAYREDTCRRKKPTILNIHYEKKEQNLCGG